MLLATYLQQSATHTARSFVCLKIGPHRLFYVVVESPSNLLILPLQNTSILFAPLQLAMPTFVTRRNANIVKGTKN